MLMWKNTSQCIWATILKVIVIHHKILWYLNGSPLTFLSDQTKLRVICVFVFVFLFVIVFAFAFVFVFVSLYKSDQPHVENNLWEVSQLPKSAYNHCHLLARWINYSLCSYCPLQQGDDDDDDETMMMRCWSQFNFAIDGVWTHSSPQWSPHSTKLQSPDHTGEVDWGWGSY